MRIRQWRQAHPLGMMLVLSVACSQLFRATRAYAAYLLIGIVALPLRRIPFDRLFRFLTALDRNVEVSVTPKPETQPHGQMKLRAIA